jgi:Carboxypeptidase regulatory-like domain
MAGGIVSPTFGGGEAMRSVRVFLSLTAAVLLAALAAAPAAAQERVAFTGQVVDASNGAPLAGAVVTIPGVGWAVTEPDGRFSIPRVEPGPYNVIIRRLDYLTDERRIRVGAAAEEPVIRLTQKALALEELRVSVNRLEGRLDRRLRSMAVAYRVFDQDRIERAPMSNAGDFVRMYGVSPVPCPHDAFTDCVMKRGQLQVLRVYVDERESFEQLGELSSYPMDYIQRVEVINGTMVRVYTRWYMRNAARQNIVPVMTF